jgi:hypothetical protein
METKTGSGGKPPESISHSVTGEKSQPVPINRKTKSINLAPPSLAAKVGLNQPNPKRAKYQVINSKPVVKPGKKPVLPKTVREKSNDPIARPEVSVVPVNRKIVKPSKIKHLRHAKDQPGDAVVIRPGNTRKKPLPVAKAVPINRKVVKQKEVRHLTKPKNEGTSPKILAPTTPKKKPRTPVKAMPINRKVVKPRTSDIFLNSEPRKDVVAVLKSDVTAESGNEAAIQKISRANMDVTPPQTLQEKLDAPAGELKSPPLQGKGPDHDRNPVSSTPDKSPAENELQMVPIEGGRPYQDKKIESQEATRKQRDIGAHLKKEPHRDEALNRVPIDAGHRERQLTMKPVEGKKRPPRSSLVQEKTKARRQNPALLQEPPQRKKQNLLPPKQKKPEKIFGDLVEDLRSHAPLQDYSLLVNPRGKMKVEFSSNSKALIVAFEKQVLPFDRIVVKQAVQPHLDRRQPREEPEEKFGIIDKFVAMIGFRKPKKESAERRGPQNRQIVGHLCSERERVVDWEVDHCELNEEIKDQENQVAVAAHYKIEGMRNFWTVQLVKDANTPGDVKTPQKSHAGMSEPGIKKSLLVLLDGLGDAIHGDLVKVS